jgi:hypothetical protein
MGERLGWAADFGKNNNTEPAPCLMIDPGDDR